jgi:signal transduction histidine kinase
MSISIFFSIMVYQLSVQELRRGLRGPRVAIESQAYPGFPAELKIAIDKERESIYNEAKARVFQRLLFINLLILFAGGALSYYLAVRTLRPIEEAHDAQNRFTADASHELRTPITAMLTENEVTLMDPKLTLQAAKLQLASNIEELQKLSTLSDNLMRLAGLENTELQKEPVVLHDVLNRAIERTAILAKAKHIEVSFSHSKQPVSIIGDESSLEEVFIILLDNAIKYSGDATHITITTVRNQKNIEIRIKDYGVGISEEAINHIFDRFYRSDPSRTNQNISGHGLGLAIAKEIIEKHNGNISVKSTQGKGSTFTVTLPVA